MRCTLSTPSIFSMFRTSRVSSSTSRTASWRSTTEGPPTAAEALAADREGLARVGELGGGDPLR